MKIRFYGLLHLAETERSAVNMAVEDFNDQVDIYLRCALTLAATLERAGETFTLLTNRKTQLLARLEAMSRTLEVEEIAFSLRVPAGLRFYSAYFKIDCFRHFGALDGVAACFVDLDVVCLGALPVGIRNNIDRGFGVAYDISDQVVPKWNRATIARDLGLLNDLRSEGRWYGGEFLCGPPLFFRRLVEAIDDVFPRYLSHVADPEGPINSSGEEPILSAALELLKVRGTGFADGGTLGIVARHWSTKPLHAQPPLGSSVAAFLVHLPDDKRILAAMADDPPDGPAAFLKQYRALALKAAITGSSPYRAVTRPGRVLARLRRAASRMMGR